MSWLAPSDDGGAPLTGYYIYYHKTATSESWSKTTLIAKELNSYTLTGLVDLTQYSFKVTAANQKGESAKSGIRYQYASPVASDLDLPSIVAGTRSITSVSIEMMEPGLSTTTVLGYQLYINEANSNAVPTNLVYDGETISTVRKVNVADLVSGQTYWLAYRVLNRAGWSNLSPYLQLTAGKLPSPPA
jgi:hypothetical protein